VMKVLAAMFAKRIIRWTLFPIVTAVEGTRLAFDSVPGNWQSSQIASK
jgi:hypothetical protein